MRTSISLAFIAAVLFAGAGCGSGQIKPADTWFDRPFNFTATDPPREIHVTMDGVTLSLKLWAETGPITESDRAIIQAQIQRIADERKTVILAVAAGAEKVATELLPKIMGEGIKGVLP